ncbi:hypothetical protein, partial [Methylicorpusculum sp.]|uniref:hypothetical protein n=1 Tax=Methylicorpusculum sp. TaxID=2713644 RepID=UPI002ABA156E
FNGFKSISFRIQALSKIDPIIKALFALIAGLVPAGIAEIRKPWMALNFDIGVIPIRLRGLSAPAIHKE